MNDCKKIQPLLSEYVDGELSDQTAWDVKLHLASCGVCACVARELADVVSLLGSLPRADTSSAFEETLARRLAGQVLQPHRPAWGERIAWWRALPRVRPALATAGALAVAIPAALVLVSGQRGSAPAAPSPVAASADQQFVEQCLEEHASFASAEPLSDPSAMLLTSRQAKATDDPAQEGPEESL